ncbi:MAG: plastocyanin/azurin family copper-binding protein [Acidimicrobiales bacterium]
MLSCVAAGGIALVGCGGGGSAGIGQAGDKANATRTIEVRQYDTPRLEPAFFNVKPSETVTFKIVNTGTRIHEFYLGNEKDQKGRESTMKEMGSSPMAMADKANGVTVDPGATKELTWTFAKSGQVLFGCHEPGDYEKGMKGTIRVSP